MYTPSYRKKKNGVPVLSQKEIDVIGERLAGDYCPDAVKTPMAVDIDGFAQNYLGLKQDFQLLSHNGVYLGMMVFNNTDRIPVYDPVRNRAEYISANARTIIIDSRLLEEDQERRYRFTVGHEVSHDIFHRGYFAYNPDQMTMFESQYSPMVQCRVVAAKTSSKRKPPQTDNDWMEWQANRLASAILMPAGMVRQLISSQPPEHSAFRAACWVMSVCHTFKVSIQAAEIRLRELGITSTISKLDIENELTLFAR